MSVVRKFRPPNRLAAMIKERGGMMAKDAIAAAEAGVETLRAPSLAVLDAALTEMERRSGSVAAGRHDEDFETLYGLALKIIDVGGFVAKGGVDQAAISLCTLVDSCGEAGVWRWQSIDVHLRALRLLFNTGEGLPEAQRASILEGLYKISQRRCDEP